MDCAWVTEDGNICRHCGAGRRAAGRLCATGNGCSGGNTYDEPSAYPDPGFYVMGWSSCEYDGIGTLFLLRRQLGLQRGQIDQGLVQFGLQLGSGCLAGIELRL